MRGQRRKRAEEAQEEAARKSAATAEQESGAKGRAAIEIVERILRHVGMWVNEIRNHGVRIAPTTGQPATETIECGQLVIELCLDDPMPDDDCNPPLWQV